MYLTKVVEERLRPLEMLKDELEAHTGRIKEGFAMRALLEYGLSSSPPQVPLAGQQPIQQTVHAQVIQARQASIQQVLQTMLPAFLRALPAILFLAFRVAIMLWVFVKDMRGFKQHAILFVAGAWFCWQVIALVRKERARIRRDERRQHPELQQQQQQQQQQRQQAEAQQQAHGAGTSEQTGTQSRGAAQPNEGVQDEADRDANPLPSPLAPQRYTIDSPLHWQWWIEHVAYFGMEEEDVELGFTPRTAHGRNAGARPRPTLFNALVTFVVLFIGTMLPEVEVRRRSAVIDREALILKTAKLESERKERVRVREEERETSTAVQASDLDESGMRHRGGQAAEEQQVPHPVDILIQDEAGPAILHTNFAERLMRKMYRPATPIGAQDAPAGEGAAAAAAAAAAAPPPAAARPDADERLQEAVEDGEGDWVGEDDFGFF